MARKPRKPKDETPAEPAKIGRPTDYSQDIADEICARLMAGETLRQIVRSDHMPARSTVHLWLVKNKAFSDQYALAKEHQADTIFDEMFDIADDGTNDWMMKQFGENEVEVVNHEHIQRSKLRIDTRKWALARMAPKKYGDRTIVAGDSDAPLEVNDSGLRGAARDIAFALRRALNDVSPE